MTLKIDINSLNSITNDFSYKSNGDYHEIKSGHLVTDLFPNSENFWKSFITPLTNRIDPTVTNHNDKIRARLDISTDIVDLSIIHYSVFLNLVYASNCLTTKHLSYFENFYAHLGSVCDLVEEFATSLYFVTLECEEKETEVLQKLSKTKYLKLAGDWYDNHYSSAFTHYLSKGKTAPFKILGRTNILDEYFGSEKAWKDYFKLAQQLRTYRNVIVHNTQIGSHITPQGIFVPKKSRIGDYKKWHQVFAVKQDKFQRDFVERDSQMNQELNDLKRALNNLWIKPFQHFDRLMYSELNPKLLKKYDIEHKGI
jgi:hypothetical protein